MSGTRPYQMTDRARAVEETRRSVIRAAGELFSDDGFADVSLSDIARSAGVSRATIYNQFESRPGLLEAVTTAAEERAGFQQLVAASEGSDAGRALVETAAELVRFYAAAGPLFANLMVLARTDPDATAMVERKEAARRELFTALVERAARADDLACDVAQVAALVVSITTHRAVQELLDGSASVAVAQERMRWLVRRLL